MLDSLKRKTGEINVFFKGQAEAISGENWHSLKYLSLLYLACLVVYYLIVCIPQGIQAQSSAVIAAICAQAVYSGAVWLNEKTPRSKVVTTYLVVFASFIAAFAIYHGTVVFPDNSALLFPLLLIMLTQFYTIHPYVSLIMITFFDVVFLTLSGILKSNAVFMLDLMSATVAYIISLVSLYTIIKFKVKVSQKQSMLNYLSEIDPLTQVLNKAGFMNEYQRAAQKAGSRDKIVLAMIDIDNFKSINDKYGHLYGDKVLRGFSDLLRQYFCSDDTDTYIGRFGGDEFILLIENAETIDYDGAQFRDFINRTEELRAELQIESICSIGVVIGAYDPNGPEALIEVADKALYSVKQQGGGDFRIVVL